ncbi:MAG: hypothetical protein JNL61_22465 [Rhizobiaceae bacterium]|nr:hypothetical protein [Rhizobiaceae bacterium]
MTSTGRAENLSALAVGIVAGLLALVLVGPLELITLRSPGVLGPSGDLAQALGGAIAYAGDSWRFPLFDVGNVMVEGRQNIIFTDSIPAYALLWKIYGCFAEPDFRFFLPAFVTLTIVLQGVSAALVLRWLDVRSLFALFAGAILFCVWPIFAFRFMMQHLALTSHWLIIIGIGLLLTAPLGGAAARRNMALWCLLVAMSLLIHGYFFAFTSALFVGRLALDRFSADRPALTNSQVLARAAFFFGLCAVVMMVSGHVGGPRVEATGFGYYSLNLAAPIIPAHTSLFVPNWMTFPLGQAEGYNYVPIAGLLLILIAIILGYRETAPARENLLSRRDAQIVVLLALALTVFAVSNNIWLGTVKLASFSLPRPIEAIAGTFRSSARFFWIVSYLILALAVATVARRLPSVTASLLLAVTAVVATVEMTPLRNLTEPVIGDYASDPAFLAVMQGERSASVYPPYPCNPESTAVVPHQIQLLAARTGVLMENGFVSARPGPGCPDGLPETMAPRPEPGRMVFLLSAKQAIPALTTLGMDDGACRQRRDIIVCLNDWTGKPQDAFFEPEEERVAPPARFSFHGDASAATLLAKGFSGIEDWGTWSVGPESHIVVPLNTGAPVPTSIRLTIGGFVSPQRPEQAVHVSLSSRAARGAAWTEEAASSLTLTEADPRREIVLARPASPADAIRITIAVPEPRSPQSLGMGDDPRPLGIAIFDLTVE